MRVESLSYYSISRFQFLNMVSWSGGDTLMISMIPAEGGKPTSVWDKVKILDGSCCWEKPVYETMKVTRDPKIGKINERLYHVVFSTGLSKFGLLGEVSINFADYALATKLSSLSLPIKNTKFEAVFYDTIERIQDSVGQREFEDGENLKDDPKDQSLRAHLSNSDIDESFKTNDSEKGSFSNMISHVAELNKATGEEGWTQNSVRSLPSSASTYCISVCAPEFASIFVQG